MIKRTIMVGRTHTCGDIFNRALIINLKLLGWTLLFFRVLTTAVLEIPLGTVWKKQWQHWMELSTVGDLHFPVESRILFTCIEIITEAQSAELERNMIYLYKTFVLIRHWILCLRSFTWYNMYMYNKHLVEINMYTGKMPGLTICICVITFFIGSYWYK